MSTRNAQTVIAEIKEIDARITERFAKSDDSMEWRTDEYNADDRETIHGLAMELARLLDKALPVVQEAVGDAYAYRRGEAYDDEIESEDREPMERYTEVAKRLGVTIS